MASDNTPISDLFNRPTEMDDILHNRASLLELRRRVATRKLFFIVGPSGCGKSALCHVALSTASVLDVGTYYMHYQGGDVGVHAQKDPKQVIAAFATRKTIEQFISASPKVVFVDDLHVLMTRDRLLCAALAALIADASISCSFVVTTTPEFAAKLQMALAVPTSAVMNFVMALPKAMFRLTHDVLSRSGYLDGDSDADDLLFLCKRSGGNWHDLFTSTDRRFQTRKIAAAKDDDANTDERAVVSVECRDDAEYHRDVVACMRNVELVEYVLTTCRDFRAAENLLDCDSAELITMTYENWMTHACCRTPRDSPIVIKPKKTPARCAQGRAAVVDAFCAIGSVYIDTAALDFHAMAWTDWPLKDLSTLLRYGSLVAHMQGLRRCPLLTMAVKTIKPNLARHLIKVAVAKKLPSSEHPNGWQAACDCAAAAGKLTPHMRPYASAMQVQLF